LPNTFFQDYLGPRLLPPPPPLDEEPPPPEEDEEDELLPPQLPPELVEGVEELLYQLSEEPELLEEELPLPLDQLSEERPELPPVEGRL